MANPIVTENQNVGTTAWIATNPNTYAIQGYVSACSVDPGGSLSVYASTSVASVGYSMYIYRLGYYGGTGARLMQTISGLTGQAQGYWDGSTLNNCPTAFSDSTTGLLEPRWASTYTLNIPSNWVTGVYIIQFQTNPGYQSYTHFTVRCGPGTDYVISVPDMTYCAYNGWGGKSLYGFNSTGGVAAVKDSFDRPDILNYGGAYLFRNDINFIKWVESQGYDVGYLSDVDIHVNGVSAITTHKAYLSLGHDEYWTFEERAAVEAARDAGIGLAFLGGNSCFVQMRLESGGQNGANRTAVVYRVAANDPQFGVDNTHVSVQWRQSPLYRPESALIGIMYIDLTNGSNFPWQVSSNAISPLLAGTGLVTGQSYGTDVTGNEWDAVGLGSPGNLDIIGASPVTGANFGVEIAHTTTYIGKGGAMVFAAGSIGFTWSLDPYRYNASNVAVIPGMQQLMAHIMTALIRPKQPTGFSAFSAHV